MSRYWVSMLSMMLGASISTTIHVWPDAPMWFVALAMCFWLAALFFFTGILHDARAPWLIPQLDLLAMHQGWTLTALPWEEFPDEWALATFTIAEPMGDAR